MSPPSETTVQALAATFTPSLQGDEARLRRIYSNFLYIYGDLPTDTQTKLAILVRILEGMSWLRYGRSLPSLSLNRRDTLCRTVANAPVGRLQAGLSGLRSLIFNATYTEPVMWETIGYAGPTIEQDGSGTREGRKPEG